MIRVLPLVLVLALGACATTTRWEKPGADEATTQHDNAECRTAAQREAFRYPAAPFSPWYGAPAPYYWRGWPGYSVYRMNWDADRFLAENRLASFCMRSRGYELVTVEEKKG